MKKEIKKDNLQKGDFVRSESGQFNDYERDTTHLFFGANKLRPALIVDKIDNEGYYLVTFGTSNINKGKIPFFIDKKVFTMNPTDSFILNNEKIVSLVESYLGKANPKWENYKLLKWKIENQIPRRKQLKEIISLIENKNYKEADHQIELQFTEPSEEDKRLKKIYREANQFHSIDKREEFLKKNINTNSSLDDEPSE